MAELSVGKLARGRPAVHALLKHLESVGFDGAPRVLGVDQDGFEVLTFIDGQTCGGVAGWPTWGRSESNLVRIARLLRRYHEAAESFRPAAGTLWRAVAAICVQGRSSATTT